MPTPRARHPSRVPVLLRPTEILRFSTKIPHGVSLEVAKQRFGAAIGALVKGSVSESVSVFQLGEPFQPAGSTVLRIHAAIPEDLVGALEKLAAPGSLPALPSWPHGVHVSWPSRPPRFRVRIVNVPPGLSVVDARRVLETTGWLVQGLVRPLGECTGCARLGTLETTMTGSKPGQQLPGSVSFLANGEEVWMRLDILPNRPAAAPTPPVHPQSQVSQEARGGATGTFPFTYKSVLVGARPKAASQSPQGRIAPAPAEASDGPPRQALSFVSAPGQPYNGAAAQEHRGTVGGNASQPTRPAGPLPLEHLATSPNRARCQPPAQAGSGAAVQLRRVHCLLEALRLHL